MERKMVVIAGERAKNLKTGGLKKCKNFTAQHAVRKMQTTLQQSAILKFEWAALIFSCCRRGSTTDVKQQFFANFCIA
jgi:hypothetical protein